MFNLLCSDDDDDDDDDDMTPPIGVFTIAVLRELILSASCEMSAASTR